MLCLIQTDKRTAPGMIKIPCNDEFCGLAMFRS